MRVLTAVALLILSPSLLHALPIAENLPDAPTPTVQPQGGTDQLASSSVTPDLLASDPVAASARPLAGPAPRAGTPLDANGNPVPLERQQPKRILGFMPNFRTVSAGAVVHPPGWKYNFTVASHQALDYSTFVFLGLTSITAEGMDSHRSLGKGVEGFYNYTWRGFLDKTDSTYLSAWLLASTLHEDTRYYPLGAGHNIPVRALYVISRQGVGRTYGGHRTPAFATLGGKVLTQYISRSYYPDSTETFDVLATKFGYSIMRDVAFSSIREFYPDIAAHYIRNHRKKMLLRQQQSMPPPEAAKP